MIVVAYTHRMACVACERMQLPPRHVTLVSTEQSPASIDKLRGRRLNPEAVVLVEDGRGRYSWYDGRHAYELERVLAALLPGGTFRDCTVVRLP